MIRTYTKTVPAGDDADRTVAALRSMLLGQAMLEGPTLDQAWDEDRTDEAVTVTLTVDDEFQT